MKLVLFAAILVAAFVVYQRPEIRALFQESKSDGNPLAFLEDLPEVQPKPRVVAKPKKRRALGQVAGAVTAPESQAEDFEKAPEFYNQVPNEELRKVLIQILAAKKLVQGISLSVSDEKVTVTGEVTSAEKREQILSIIDRGRESRKMDGTHLIVQK